MNNRSAKEIRIVQKPIKETTHDHIWLKLVPEAVAFSRTAHFLATRHLGLKRQLKMQRLLATVRLQLDSTTPPVYPLLISIFFTYLA